MANPIAVAAIDLLKKELAKKVLALAIAKAPFLASAFVNPIAAWFISIIIDVLYDKMALGVNWVWSIVENHAELKAAIKTRDKLAGILAAGGDYTKAEKEFDDATDDLIRRDIDDGLPR